MELKPKIGIDNLVFGMSQKDIVGILGEPNRTFQLDDFDDNEMVWEWNEKMLRLTFYKEENDRFGYLRTMHPDLNYNGKKILNLPPKFVKENIFSELKQWDKNEFDFDTLYFNEQYWLNLTCQYGRVIELEMGVPFKNEEDYDWPN